MRTNDTRTQERAEQAIAAHLDSAAPERYTYIMKHIGPWTDGYLTGSAQLAAVQGVVNGNAPGSGEYNDGWHDAMDAVTSAIEEAGG